MVCFFGWVLVFEPNCRHMSIAHRSGTQMFEFSTNEEFIKKTKSNIFGFRAYAAAGRCYYMNQPKLQTQSPYANGTLYGGDGANDYIYIYFKFSFPKCGFVWEHDLWQRQITLFELTMLLL